MPNDFLPESKFREKIAELEHRLDRLENGGYDAAQERILAQGSIRKHQGIAQRSDTRCHSEKVWQGQSGQAIGGNCARTISPDQTQSAIGLAPIKREGELLLPKTGIYYLAGPMRGLPDKNFALFNAIAYSLREKGYSIINPAEIAVSLNVGLDAPSEVYLKEDFRFLLNCTGIILLPGWEGSAGARKERKLAKWTGLEIYLWSKLV